MYKKKKGGGADRKSEVEWIGSVAICPISKIDRTCVVPRRYPFPYYKSFFEFNPDRNICFPPFCSAAAIHSLSLFHLPTRRQSTTKYCLCILELNMSWGSCLQFDTYIMRHLVFKCSFKSYLQTVIFWC